MRTNANTTTPEPVPCPNCASIMDPRRVVCTLCAENGPDRQALRKMDLCAHMLTLLIEENTFSTHFPMGAIDRMMQARDLIRENAETVRYGRDD